MTHKKIRVADFDFDTIKGDFKTFLKGTAEFTDYNFEGSNLNVLFDILAYNTHYSALTANFVANEMYLDTAAKRSSVVSHAKKLGYRPQSTVSAKATLDVVINTTSGSSPTSLVLPAGTIFTTTVDNETYQFSTISAYSTARVGSNPYSYTFSNVEIYGGSYITQDLVYDDLTNKVSILNTTADMNTLSVRVDSLETNTDEVYTSVSNILEVNSNSNIFYLQEGFLEEYEILFGDDVLGHQPAVGSIVNVSYIASVGSAANGANAFTLSTSFGISMPFTSTITVIEEAKGGKEKEAIDSIKFNATNYFGAQNRAVISNDYKLLVSLNGGNVKSVIAWGGEDNIPPKFGFVILCVVPESGETLTESEEESIREYIRSKAVANTLIEFIDPEYLDLVIDTTIVYDKTKLSGGVFELESIVRSEINNYAIEKLSQFNGVFRYSNLIHEIDVSDPSILNNLMSIRIIREVTPTLFENKDITIKVANELNETDSLSSFSSTGFFIPNNSNKMFFEDNRKGLIRIFYKSGSEKLIYASNAGTINYTKGEIYINPLIITGFDGDEMVFSFTPAKLDLISTRNVVLRIQDKNITVKSRADYV